MNEDSESYGVRRDSDPRDGLIENGLTHSDR